MSGTLGLIYFNLGNTHRYAGQTDIAIEAYKKGIAAYQQTEHTLMLMMLHTASGNLFANSGDFEQARLHLDEAKRCYGDGEGVPPELEWTLYTLSARVFENDGSINDALVQRRLALQAARRATSQRYIGEALLGIGRTLTQMGDFIEALTYLEEAKAILERLEDTQATQMALTAGEWLQVAGDYQEVDALLQPSAKQEDGLNASPYSENIPETDLVYFVASGVAHEQDYFVRLLEETTLPKYGILCIFDAQNAHVLVSSKAEAITPIDILRPETWKEIDSILATWPDLTSWTQIGQAVCQQGVDVKTEWRFYDALCLYRFALHISLWSKSNNGIQALSANLLILNQHIQTLWKYAPFYPPSPITEAIVAAHGGAEQGQSPDNLLADIRYEAERSIPLIQDLLRHASGTQDRKTQIALLKSLRRFLALSTPQDRFESQLLADWVGGGILGPGPSALDRKRRVLLMALVKLAEDTSQPEHILEGVYEEMAHTYLSELRAMQGRNISPSPLMCEKLDLRGEEFTPAGFEDVWHLYLRYRPQLINLQNLDVLAGASLALNHLLLLRIQAIYSGTASGARSSYDVASFIGAVGRDIISILLETNHQAEALQIAEEIGSRSMTDWMGRTHLNNRITMRRNMRGSAGEVCPASLHDIYLACQETGATFLYYVALQNGYAVWILHPDGRCKFERIDDIQELIDNCLSMLPYPTDVQALSRTPRDIRNAALRPITEDELNATLLELGSVLLPEAIRSLLPAKDGRLLIIADQSLGFIPFACLRLDANISLIDLYEIIYWPSVTAWLLCKSEEESRKDARREVLPSVVIGNPDFSEPRTIYIGGKKTVIRFTDLPGSALEARAIGDILGVTPWLGPQARFTALHEHFLSNSFVPILHLATHGACDMEAPETSCIVFSDTELSAYFLYQYDPGLRCGLVMMSCCQSAMGHPHMDSLVSLTNAFLIAGACTVGSYRLNNPGQPRIASNRP